MTATRTGAPWRLPAGLEPFRAMIVVDPHHGLTLEELVNLPGSAPIADARHLDRQRVIAQCKLLLRLHNAGHLTPPDSPGNGRENQPPPPPNSGPMPARNSP